MSICERCKAEVDRTECIVNAGDAYCVPCSIIVYHEIPAEIVAAIEHEIAGHRARGVDEVTLQKLRLSTLRREAAKHLRDVLSGTAGPVKSMRSQVLEQ